MTTEPELLIISAPAYVMKNLGTDILIGRNILQSAGLNIDISSDRPVRYGRGVSPVYLTELNPMSDPPKKLEAENAQVYTTEPLGDATVRVGKLLEDWQREELRNFLNNHLTCFATKASELGYTDVIQHTIDTGDAPPTNRSLYHLRPDMREAVQKQIDKLLRLGIIRISRSPWRHPIVAVKKKDGSIRVCIDYRATNARTQPDALVRAMNYILKPVIGHSCSLYFYILLYHKTFKEHIECLQHVFALLRAGLKLNMKKCMFALPELTFLGH